VGHLGLIWGHTPPIFNLPWGVGGSLNLWEENLKPGKEFTLTGGVTEKILNLSFLRKAFIWATGTVIITS